MNLKSSKIIIITLALTALFLVSACSPTAEKLNQEGNQSFDEQAYDEAQIAYTSAAEEDPALAEPYYNLANTLYRKGGFDQAVQLIQQALSLNTEEDLAQNSLYNLGNNTFNMQNWNAAVEAYKQALLINPDDLDAKYNLELALQMQQEQEQQQQEQNQENESEQEEEQNQDSQSEDQQDQQQESSENSEENQDQGEDEQDQQGEDNSQEEQEQNSDQSQEEESQEQQGESQPDEGQEGNQPWESPQPGERMTEEQAKQLLEALIQNSQTLQEKLGQILFVRDLPPVQDW